MRVEIIGHTGEGKTTLAQLIIRAIRENRKHARLELIDKGDEVILFIDNFKNLEEG